MNRGPASYAVKLKGIIIAFFVAALLTCLLGACASSSPLADAARKEMEAQKKAAKAAAPGEIKPPGPGATAKPGEPPKPGEPVKPAEAAPPEKQIVIDKKPQKYGVYIYREGKFISLPTLSVSYSGVWFPISLTSKKLAACYVSSSDVKDVPSFQEGDLLCIHYKNAGKRPWYYYPLTRFPQSDFPGSNEAEIWERPSGHYLGFSAIGPGPALKKVFGRAFEDGYRFDQQRIKPEDIVYQESAILFAKLTPADRLAVSRYLITSKSVSFSDVSDYQDLLSQITDEGVALDMAQAAAVENFEGMRDAIERYNEDSAVRYILNKKEFVLKKNQILDTGIMINEQSFVRFLSDGDFNLILRPGEWEDQGGWMPADQPFGKDAKELPLIKGTFAHQIKLRHFALRYERTTIGTQVRLQGINDGVKVTVVYSPMFCYEDTFQDHVKKGYEYHNQGLYKEAEAEYEAALNILPDYPYALNNLAWLYATATDEGFKNPKKALELAVQAARFRPVRPYVMDTLSLSWYLNGNLDKAIELQQAASIAVADSESYSQVYSDRLKTYMAVKDQLTLASRFEGEKRPLDAVRELEKALIQMPQCVDALDRMAWIYATSKDTNVADPKKALAHAQKAYAISPDSAHVCDTLSEAFFANGNREKALEMAQRAWRLEPFSDYYRERVERFGAKKK